jgi:YihY family inner membrane protein
VRNIAALAQTRHSVHFTSVIILLVSSSGVFLPLEVAFNQIWGFAKNRSYIGNQLISFVLAFACGTLGLISVSLATGNYLLLAFVMGGHTDNIIFRALAFVLMKVFSMLATVAIFFLIYWLLPNGKVPAKKVLRASVVVGLVWEAAKYIYIFALPWLGFREVYGPFTIAVTLMVWAFVSGLLVLAGAHLVASPPGASGPPAEPPLPGFVNSSHGASPTTG